MRSPAGLAQRYLDEGAALREALDMPRRARIEAVPIGQGEHNANFRFVHPVTKKAYVLRINFASQMGLADQIGYEAHALGLLAPSGRVPHVFHVDSEPGIDGHGVLAMEFCQGRHLDFLRPGDVACAARMLADIHAVDPSGDQVLARPEDPLRAQLEECRRLFAGYRNTPFESVQVTSFVERFFERAEHVAIAAGSPGGSGHVLNTEAVSDHFLIPEDAPDDGHMVDWEKPVVGEVAKDVAYFLAPTTTIWSTDFVFTAEERDAFVHTYWQAVGGRFARGNFEARYAAYLMSNCLRGVTWSCNAWVEYHDPARPLKNPKTFEKLKVYLSETFLAYLEREIFPAEGPRLA